METTSISNSNNDSSLGNTDFKTPIEKLRTATWEFLDKVQIDDIKGLIEHIEDLRSRVHELGDNPVPRPTKEEENNSDQGTLHPDVVARLAFTKLSILVNVYLRNAQPYGTGTVNVRAARALVSMVRGEFDKLNTVFPTSLKMPGEMCLRGKLGPNPIIKLDWDSISRLQFNLKSNPPALHEEDKTRLDDDWKYQLKRAFLSLKDRLICPECGYIHHCPIVTEMRRQLYSEMYGFDPRYIQQGNVQHWEYRMRGIEERYAREIGVSRS